MIRFSVIGIGRMGNIHAENLIKNRVPGATLIAVCDLDTEKLASFIRKHKDVLTFTDYKEMFSVAKPDAVLVATPHYSHVPIVMDALSMGIHTLSEKPAAVSVTEAQKAIDAANRSGGVLYGIMYNQRTNRMYQKAKELLSSGVLGAVQRVNLIITDWYRSQHYYDQGEWRASWSGEGGGILINQCVHQLDILQWLIGMPKSILAFLKTVNRKITVENDVTAVMDYQDFTCVFTASGHELKGTNRLEIACENGKIVIEKYKMRYSFFAKSESEVNSETSKGYGFSKSKVKRMNYGLFRLLKEAKLGQQINILKNFTAALEGHEKLIADGREGIKALTIINAIYMSAYKGMRVHLPLDGEEFDKLLIDLKQNEAEVKKEW